MLYKLTFIQIIARKLEIRELEGKRHSALYVWWTTR